jgi:DNA repair photolyase
MNTALAIAGYAPSQEKSHLLQVHFPHPPVLRSLPRIEWRRRQGPLLGSCQLAGDGAILSLNLTAGTRRRLHFLSLAEAAESVVPLYTDTAARLAAELAVRGRKARAVLVSPFADPFAPLAEIQAETGRVIETLAGQGIEAWIMTRGYVRPFALQMLTACRPFVRVTIGLTTLDRPLQRLLEPLAASPRVRLRQIAQLRQLGIPIRVMVGPLLPGLTDTRTNLVELLEALAPVGVQHVTAGYLFLQPGSAERLASTLEVHGLDGVLEAFQDGTNLRGGRYLAKTRRQRGYAALMALASRWGITVGVCNLANPDFRPVPQAASRRCQRLLY